MATIEKALIVGGGIGGMSAALQLRKRGIPVDLLDSDPEWRALGAGITITGPTLRAFKRLGIMNEIGKAGFFSPTVSFFATDGRKVGELDRPPLEDDLPSAGGILRPVLHDILASRVRNSGTNVRLGVTLSTLEEADGVVRVGFSDGSSGAYQLVVGADGVHSALRRRLFPDAQAPRFTGQGCWRMLADRPAHVNNAEIYMGPTAKVGVNPCSPDKMYLFVTLAMPGNPRVAPEELSGRLSDILSPFGGTIKTVRSSITPESRVNYRPLEMLLLDQPWHRGAVGLIGDAIHATTPHLASGAGITVEDAIVLDEEMERGFSVSAAWSAFSARRYERCAMVVNNSVRIGELEMKNQMPEEQTRLLNASMQALGEPI